MPVRQPRMSRMAHAWQQQQQSPRKQSWRGGFTKDLMKDIILFCIYAKVSVLQSVAIQNESPVIALIGDASIHALLCPRLDYISTKYDQSEFCGV